MGHTRSVVYGSVPGILTAKSRDIKSYCSRSVVSNCGAEPEDQETGAILQRQAKGQRRSQTDGCSFTDSTESPAEQMDLWIS